METESVNTSSTRRRALAAIVGGMLLIAACGDDDDDGSGAGDTAATTGDTAGGGDTTAATSAAPGTTGAPGTTTGGGGGVGELAGGDVFVTGSSTVQPISIRVGELAGELSGGELAVTVEGPGTGDGFAAFCAGQADISDASRPISEEEVASCEEGGIEFVELEIAIDGLTVATNPANDAITCLDVPALYALVGPESEGTASWSDNTELATEVGSAYADAFPDAPLDISGPGEESGTYDTFVEFAIADLAEERGQEEATRADYSSSPNDNLIVEGIEGSESSLGWIGYAYYLAEAERMKAIEIDGGEGCVAPTEETISGGSYPFSRSLYIYVNTANAESNPAVASFVDLYLSDDGLAAVTDAGYVSLPDDRIQATRDAWAGG
jgi:phosphate transport system substrate-binding protein